MISSYLILVICFVTYIIYWAWTNRRELKLSWRMPGLFPYVPFVGVIWRFFVQENIEAIDSLLKPFDDVDEPVGIWLGTKFLVFVDNPRDIETVLTSPNCVRDEIYQYIKEVIGVNGIFTSEGEIWRKHRRLVSPSFSEKVVMSYVPIFSRRSEDLMKKLQEMVNKEPFDIRRYIVDFALDAFFEATFSCDVDKESRMMFHKYIKIGQSIIGKRFFLPWYRSEWIWKLSGYFKLSQKIARDSNEGMKKIMEKVMQHGSSELTFLERLIRVSEEHDDFTMDDVKAEALTALTAGSDTSTWSMAFTILLLAMHPEHQERVYEELKTILPSKTTKIRAEHIRKMKYLELCINESLRLYPTVALISKTVKHGPVNLNGYEIHPGMSIVVGIHRVHRKKKYWGSNANQFDPTRFSPENISKVKPFAYIPFSDGLRDCVGNRYAYVAMKSILATILRNYRLTTPLKLEELKVRMKVNIFLLNKHMVQIYDRND